MSFGYIAATYVVASVLGIPQAIEADKARRADRQADDQERAARRNELRTRQRQADIKARRARIKSIREARTARAGVQQAGITAGVGQGSSAIQGGIASIGTQSAAVLGAANQISTLSSNATIFNIAASTAAQNFTNQASSARGRGAFAERVGSIGRTIFLGA